MIETIIFHDGYEHVRLSKYLQEKKDNGFKLEAMSVFDYKGTMNYKVLIVFSK